MREAADRTGILLPPPAINALGLALGIALDIMVPIGALRMAFAPRMILGIGVTLAGMVLAAWAIKEFRRAGTTPNPYGGTSLIVPEGPYRRTRNPMYVGMLTSYLGIALMWGGYWTFLLWPIVALALHYGVVLREERYLSRKFGAEYDAYCTRVRRWL